MKHHVHIRHIGHVPIIERLVEGTCERKHTYRGVLLEHKLFKISDGKFIRCHTHPDGSCFFHSILIATNVLKNRYSTSSKRRNLGLQLRELLCAVRASDPVPGGFALGTPYH